MRILKKSLNITFINPNTEEQIVQAMAGCLAYNLAENDENIKFDYSNSNTYQSSHEEIEDELATLLATNKCVDEQIIKSYS